MKKYKLSGHVLFEAKSFEDGLKKLARYFNGEPNIAQQKRAIDRFCKPGTDYSIHEIKADITTVEYIHKVVPVKLCSTCVWVRKVKIPMVDNWSYCPQCGNKIYR